MDRNQLAALRRLSTSDETWQFARRRMRVWITPPGEEPQRPYVLLCQSLSGPIIYSEIVAGPSSSDGVLRALMQAMRAPMESAGPPRRPSCVQFEEAELVEDLAAALQMMDVACEQASLDLLQESLLDLEAHLRGRDPIPGLLADPESTVERVAGFFSAAAFFYRTAPWRWLSDAEPLAVSCPPTSRQRYAIVLGNAGLEYGLGVYGSWSAVQAIYESRRPQRTIPGLQGLAVMYGSITELPFDDLDGLEAHGWEVAAEEAYPIPVALPVRKGVQRPSAGQLGWLECALRAIPLFVRDHVATSTGTLRPAEATIEVAVSSGTVPVHLAFPAKPGRASSGAGGTRRRSR